MSTLMKTPTSRGFQVGSKSSLPHSSSSPLVCTAAESRDTIAPNFARKNARRARPRAPSCWGFMSSWGKRERQGEKKDHHGRTEQQRYLGLGVIIPIILAKTQSRLFSDFVLVVRIADWVVVVLIRRTRQKLLWAIFTPSVETVLISAVSLKRRLDPPPAGMLHVSRCDA